MGFFDKIRSGLQKTKANIGETLDSVLSVFRKVDEETLEELEDALILSDIGAQTAAETIDELRERAKRQSIETKEELVEALCQILTEKMTPNDGLHLNTHPSVILVIGVNGVGKTTTIGKLGASLKGEGKKVLLCAGDTFRAAAAEQLTVWAQRSGAEIVKQHEGADPAAVVFDAVSAAKARNTDVILVDTAGRLHNKQNLMNELNKISRVIDRELPGCARETLLVLDATTGQNGLIQAKQFREAAGVTGIVLTKLDGTAKGGITVAIANELQIPVKYIGLGEGVEDLRPFDAEAFTEALV